MARRTPLSWQGDLYLKLFDRAFAKDCDPVERAHAVEVMHDLVDGRLGRTPGYFVGNVSLGELIRTVLAERLDP